MAGITGATVPDSGPYGHGHTAERILRQAYFGPKFFPGAYLGHFDGQHF